MMEEELEAIRNIWLGNPDEVFPHKCSACGFMKLMNAFSNDYCNECDRNQTMKVLPRDSKVLLKRIK